MLIATDLDGTLLAPDAAAPSQYTVDVLRRVDEAGIPVVFVTGRPLRWMDGLWGLVAGHGMAIVSNGAIAYDVHAREAVRVAGIEPRVGLRLAEAIARAVPGVTFAVECLDGLRHEPGFVDDPRRVAGHSRLGALEQVWDVVAVKLLVRHRGRDHDRFHDHVESVVQGQATATWSVPGLAEISAKDVTKASALIELCHQLDVPPAEVVAFGDMPNDIAMLAWAGTSYATANAHRSVLAVADHVAQSCEQDGVARVLETLLAGRV